MSLALARDQVMDSIVDGTKTEIIASIWDWFNVYKRWEGEDTFLAAFREKRLCITQRPSAENVKGAIQTEYEMEAKRGSGEKAAKIKYPGVKYAVGVASLAQRLDPSNFVGVNDQGIKRKYALGLFDLSASLLNPEYPTIKGQLRWTIDGTKAGWRVVFIPLPEEEDVALYNALSRYAKAIKDPDLQRTMEFIRHRMTRPKLAAAEDMGAGPYDVAPAGSSPKIKYGWKSDEGVLTKETRDRARTAKFRYQSIIANARPIVGRGDVKVVASNEVTIALRQRNGKRFPIVTKYDADADAFLFSEPNDFFPDRYIPDAWERTREARMV